MRYRLPDGGTVRPGRSGSNMSLSEPGAPDGQASSGGQGEPEDVRDGVAALIEARDGQSLRVLWPGPAWEDWAAELVQTFVPSSDDGACDEFEHGRASCFIFANDEPFVIGLTMAQDSMA